MTTHNYINDLMQTASSWNHDVSLSGGTDKTKFYSSVNYMDDEGIRVKSGFQRWNANFKLTQKINKKLTADFDLRYSEIEINGSGLVMQPLLTLIVLWIILWGMLLLPLDLVKVIQIWKKLVILCIT